MMRFGTNLPGKCLSRSLAALFCFMMVTSSAVSASRPEVEQMFKAWVGSDLWNAARARGVSQATYNSAMSGITLNWDLPDLVPPGSKAPQKRRQSQAEFGSPGAYFSEKRLQGLASSGRSLAGKWDGALKAAEQRYAFPAGSSSPSGAVNPALDAPTSPIPPSRCLPPRLLCRPAGISLPKSFYRH